MVILTFVVMAFLVGLNNLYWYYADHVRTRVEVFSHGTEHAAAEDSFGTYARVLGSVCIYARCPWHQTRDSVSVFFQLFC